MYPTFGFPESLLVMSYTSFVFLFPLLPVFVWRGCQCSFFVVSDALPFVRVDSYSDDHVVESKAITEQLPHIHSFPQDRASSLTVPLQCCHCLS